MTTNKAAEALLAAFSINERDPHDGTVIGHVLRDDPREKVAAVIAEATAAAEVARLREALDGLVKAVAFQNSAWGSVPGQAQADFAVREAQAVARAALAAAPAVAPDPAPPAPDERCEDCAGNFVDGYCRRHEPSFHGYNGAVSVPEPRP